MLLPFAPVAFIASPIGPGIDSIAILFIKFVGSFVLTTVFPSIEPDTMHIIILPLTSILPAVIPGVGPLAFDPVLDPGAVVGRTVRPDVEALAVLLALMVEALVH